MAKVEANLKGRNIDVSSSLYNSIYKGVLDALNEQSTQDAASIVGSLPSSPLSRADFLRSQK